MEANGLKEGELDIHDDAVRDLVRYYTREAGVRNLEREIANLGRKGVKEILMKGTSKVKITAKNLDKYAGVRRFRYGEAELEDLVGITTGLAWTEVGGELLQIEAVLVPGRGRVTVTGKLGDVMQESVQAANAYVRSRAAAFGIKPNIFEKRDIHVHVPEGATPKDGPSAGVGMITSIVSALTGYRGPQGRGHDRRDQPARAGHADRRPQGKAAGGVARRSQDRAHPEGERARPSGDPGQREEGPADRARLDRGRGLGPGAGQAADGDRVAERPRAGAGQARGGTRSPRAH